MSISRPPTPCQHTAFPSRSIQPLSFQPAQSTGSARPGKTSQCAPLHPNAGLRFLSSPPNWDEALHLTTTPFPHTLPEWGSCLHGYLSPASSPSSPSQIEQRFLLSLSQTHTDTPFYCPGWTRAPNLEPLHAEFLLLQLPSRGADLLL